MWENDKGTGAEMRLAIVFGIIAGDAQVSHWSILFLCLATVPEVFANVNSDQSPRF